MHLQQLQGCAASRAAVLLLLLCMISSCSATARDLQQQRSIPGGLTVTLKDVHTYTRTAYRWEVETDIDKPAATFELTSSDAAPKGPGSNQQQIGYTVFYNRVQSGVMHVLAGTISISNTQKGAVWIDSPTVVITTRKGKQQQVRQTKCLTVIPARRSVTCSFEAHWHTEKYPRAGEVHAVVAYEEKDADEEEEAADTFKSARVPFDFSKAKLQQAVWSTAEVEAGWEPAAANQGVLQPVRSTGDRPKAKQRIDSSKAFKFVAVIEPGPTTQSQLCARPWKVVHQAKVTPLGSGNTPMTKLAQVDEKTVTVTFTGCPPSPSTPPSSPPEPKQMPSPSPTLPRPVAPNTPAAPPLPPAITPTPPVTPVAPVNPLGPPWVNPQRVCAYTQQVCPEGSVCPDGLTCCPTSNICGSACCRPPNSCQLGICVEPCGNGPACTGGRVCMTDSTCCFSSEQPCAGQCCPFGQVCAQSTLYNRKACLPQGQSLCGATGVCAAGLECREESNGVCCPLGAGPVCGPVGQRGCCPAGHTCEGDGCVPPTPPSPSPWPGMTCGGKICDASETCSDPATGPCCNRQTTTACYGKCCRLDEVCNHNTKVCASRDPPAYCPRSMWCPGAMEGAVCCSSLGNRVCLDLNRCVLNTNPNVVPPPVLPVVPPVIPPPLPAPTGRPGAPPPGTFTCGSGSCVLGSICLNGACCSSGNVCGAVCCGPPMVCSSGRCMSPPLARPLRM